MQLLLGGGVVMWSAEISWLRHKLVRSLGSSPLARDCSLSERDGRGLDEMTSGGLLERPFSGARLSDQGRRSKWLGRRSFEL